MSDLQKFKEKTKDEIIVDLERKLARATELLKHIVDTKTINEDVFVFLSEMRQ